jgi:hypothetical protein
MNPVTLLLWSLSGATDLVVLVVCALAIVVAFVVFGGGWQ